MLYASILDKYFSYQVDKFHKVTSENYSKYISKVDQFFKENDAFKEILAGTDLADKLEAKALFPKKKKINIQRKKEIYFNHIGEERLKIFINSDDFKNIKDIRDRAAHGAPEKLDTDIVYKYLWKVKILTMYFIYMDLGIKENDF